MTYTPFPVGLFTSGAILTASQMNTYIRDNLTDLRGDFDQVTRTAGDITVNGTSWANLSTTTDLVVAAETGDILEVCLSGLGGNEGVDMFIDVVTLVSGSPVNSFGSQGAVNASGQGVLAWRSNASVLTSVGGSVFWKVVAGDISSGNVTCRFRARTSPTATNKTFYSSANLPLLVALRNHGNIQV